MIQIKKEIKNGYINFLNEIRNDSKIINRNGYGKNNSWGSIVAVYDTVKYIRSTYFDFINYELDIKNLKKGNVLNLRNELVMCRIDSFVFNEFYLIISITNDEIVMEKYESIAKAVRAQRKKSISQGFIPIPRKSKLNKSSKHNRA